MNTLRVPLLALALLAGCGGAPERNSAPTPTATSSADEPDRIVVDHILIGVRGPNFQQGRRTEAEARQFAYELLERVRAGEDWAAAKRANSEDPPPGGPYALANRGVPRSDPQEFPRDGMVPAFGDVGFTLDVGEVGIADYHATKSPFGFHLIRRVK